MTIIHIGSDTEFIKISLPPSYSIEGWAQATVDIAVRGFAGTISPWVEAGDFERFTAQLRTIYDSLSGQAEFSPLEQQFTLKLSCGTGGHVQATGVAWSQATHENKLEYVIELDQSFLQGPLRELENLVGASENMRPNSSFNTDAQARRST